MTLWGECERVQCRTVEYLHAHDWGDRNHNMTIRLKACTLVPTCMLHKFACHVWNFEFAVARTAWQCLWPCWNRQFIGRVSVTPCWGRLFISQSDKSRLWFEDAKYGQEVIYGTTYDKYKYKHCLCGARSRSPQLRPCSMCASSHAFTVTK